MGLGRLRGFLYLSGALIGAAAVFSGLFVGALFEEHVLTRDEQHTAESVLNEVREDLSPEIFEFRPDPSFAPTFGHVLLGLPQASQVTVYDQRARVIWSNEPGLIGKTFADNADLVKARSGSVTTVIRQPNTRGKPTSSAYFSDAYVPITFPGSERIVGVFEIHKDVTALVHGVRRIQRLIWAIAGGLGLLLYAGVAFVARSAPVDERRAIRQLEQQNREFMALQAQLVEKERLAAVGEIVVGLHHAILNPLAGILGVLNVLKVDALTAPERARALANAEIEIRKVERVIRHLPDLRHAKGVLYVNRITMVEVDRASHSEDGDRGI